MRDKIVLILDLNQGIIPWMSCDSDLKVLPCRALNKRKRTASLITLSHRRFMPELQ